MKKNLLLLACTLIGTMLFAQVPNGSFETWNKQTVNVLKEWKSQGKHEKVAGPNSKDAVRISSDDEGNVGIVAYVDLSDDLNNLKGGFPYTAKPSKVRVNLRYNIAVGDTALLIVVPSTSGIPSGLNFFRLTGTQNTFTNQEFDLVYFIPVVPDSMVLGFTSGNILGTSLPGSWVEVSKVEFLDAKDAVMTAVPNGDFSQWEVKTTESLASWSTTTDLLRAFGSKEEPVKKSVEHSSGNYSLQLKTIKVDKDTIAGIAFTTKSPSDFNVESPAFKVTEKHLSLQGKYKYLPEGNDSFIISTILYFQGTKIAYGQFTGGGKVDNFTPFSLDITYDAPLTPDSATIIIFNTNPDNPGTPGTTLWVDEIALKEWNTSVQDLSSSHFILSPNPATDFTQIKVNHGNAFTVKVLNIAGQIIETYNNVNSRLELNTTNYTKGIYFIKIESNNHTTTQKLIVK